MLDQLLWPLALDFLQLGTINIYFLAEKYIQQTLANTKLIFEQISFFTDVELVKIEEKYEDRREEKQDGEMKENLRKSYFPPKLFLYAKCNSYRSSKYFYFFFYNQHLPKSVEMKKRKFNRIYLNRKKVCPVFVRLPFAIHVKILLPVEIRSKFFIWYLCHQII